MSLMTVKEVGQPDPWKNEHGDFITYPLLIEGVEKVALLNQKASTQAPTSGQQLDLELIPHPKFNDKLKAKRVQQMNSPGGRRSSDPKERASIEMQSSIRSAVDLTVGLARADKLPADFASTEKLTEAIVAISKAFFAAIQEVSKGA